MGKILGTILKPLTTAAPIGVFTRDLWQVAMTVITILGALSILSDEQVEMLTGLVKEISGQWPQIVAAIGTLGVVGMGIYRTVFQSYSDKSATLAKQADLNLAPDETAVLKTPPGQPDIAVNKDAKVVSPPKVSNR